MGALPEAPKETPLQKIAKKVQNRFSWSGEELEILLSSKPVMRKKSNSSTPEKKARRRSWLDHILGSNDSEIEAEMLRKVNKNKNKKQQKKKKQKQKKTKTTKKNNNKKKKHKQN